MPIIVKAKGNDSTSDVIRKFKKVVSATDIVNRVKDRAYFKKPSQVLQEKKKALRRAKKRLRSLKRMKNISPESLERLVQSMSHKGPRA